MVYCGNSNYLDNWVLHFIVGPEKIYYNTNFKNLKHNAYKQNLDEELKKIEEDVENGGKCPKYFKTWQDEKNLRNTLEIELSKNPAYTENVKSIYLSMGGIWVTNNSQEPIPTSSGGQQTDKYTKLWENAKQQYITQEINKRRL